jgi:hypothetical protein
LTTDFFTAADTARLRKEFPGSDVSLEAHNTILCVLEILDTWFAKGIKTIAAIAKQNPGHAKILREVLEILEEIPDPNNFLMWLFLAQ